MVRLVPKSHVRLLKMMDILKNETDAHHELSLEALNEKLKIYFDVEENFDARSLKRDIEALDHYGFEVIVNKGKYGKNLYSHQARLFESYQLRLLVDAVLSARFITAKDKDVLVKSIQKLTSQYEAKKLPNTIIFNPTANIDYHLVKLNIDQVHEAISLRRVIRYQYGKYNVAKAFELNRDGAWYQAEPYALVWQNDYYYLIAKHLETGELRHYRLDRMRNIELKAETFKRDQFDTSQYIDQTFHMFAGEERRIKLKFHHDLINVVIDRFGLDADIRALDDTYILLNTKAKISSGLISWILRWGKDAIVVAPDLLKGKVKAEIKAMYESYQD